jgi:hypothetical protein
MRNFLTDKLRGAVYCLKRSTKMNASQTKFTLGMAALCFGWVVAAEQQARLTGDLVLPGKEIAPGVRLLGHIENRRITESSGVVASRKHPGVFWTHNDGGGARRQVLYAISREGRSLAAFPVTDVFLNDWEDIAIDDQDHLFISDTGNNELRRRELAVHEIDEPDPTRGAGVVRPKRTWRLAFPDQPFDCETLFVWKDYGYVVSKLFKDRRAQIFRFPLKNTSEVLTLELVATLRIESPVTGGDISPDGRLLALVSKSGAFVYRIDGDVAEAGKRKFYQTKFRHEHIEGCCFVPEGLLATAESREIYLFTEAPFHWKRDSESNKMAD